MWHIIQAHYHCESINQYDVFLIHGNELIHYVSFDHPENQLLYPPCLLPLQVKHIQVAGDYNQLGLHI